MICKRIFAFLICTQIFKVELSVLSWFIILHKVSYIGVKINKFHVSIDLLLVPITYSYRLDPVADFKIQNFCGIFDFCNYKIEQLDSLQGLFTSNTISVSKLQNHSFESFHLIFLSRSNTESKVVSQFFVPTDAFCGIGNLD